MSWYLHMHNLTLVRLVNKRSVFRNFDVNGKDMDIEEDIPEKNLQKDR